jgi:hypothetical protein
MTKFQSSEIDKLAKEFQNLSDDERSLAASLIESGQSPDHYLGIIEGLAIASKLQDIPVERMIFILRAYAAALFFARRQFIAEVVKHSAMAPFFS